MMMNLFSSFDPNSIFNIQLNWTSSMLFLFLFPNLFWLIPSRTQMLWILIFKMINKELKTIMKNKMIFQNNLLITSLFMFVLLNNFMGLFPYIFTSTSHLILTLSISIPFWISFMIYGWINNTNHMFMHLIPNGTPSILMPFMACIETISNIIRPMTLAVRLSANMIAGHLIMTLLGNSGSTIPINLIIILIFFQIMLLILETAVSMIQSYVITILISLYSSEIN